MNDIFDHISALSNQCFLPMEACVLLPCSNRDTVHAWTLDSLAASAAVFRPVILAE